MSTPAPSTVPHDLVEAAAMRDLVTHLHRLVTNRTHPDQAITVHVTVDTPDAVRVAAERAHHRHDVKVTVDPVGNVITRLVIGFGLGTNPTSPDPRFAYAAVLELAHVEFSTAALDIVEDVLGDVGADR